jgi:hypothetical protein
MLISELFNQLLSSSLGCYRLNSSQHPQSDGRTRAHSKSTSCKMRRVFRFAEALGVRGVFGSLFEHVPITIFNDPKYSA